jgi:hypothetical protein
MESFLLADYLSAVLSEITTIKATFAGIIGLILWFINHRCPGKIPNFIRTAPWSWLLIIFLTFFFILNVQIYSKILKDNKNLNENSGQLQSDFRDLQGAYDRAMKENVDYRNLLYKGASVRIGSFIPGTAPTTNVKLENYQVNGAQTGVSVASGVSGVTIVSGSVNGISGTGYDFH